MPRKNQPAKRQPQESKRQWSKKKIRAIDSRIQKARKKG